MRPRRRCRCPRSRRCAWPRSVHRDPILSLTLNGPSHAVCGSATFTRPSPVPVPHGRLPEGLISADEVRAALSAEYVQVMQGLDPEAIGARPELARGLSMLRGHAELHLNFSVAPEILRALNADSLARV